MGKEINFNGKILNTDQAVISTENRVFNYGDGLFETIRVFDGQVPFLEYHFDRLKKGMLVLKMDVPEYFSVSFFKNEIQKLIGELGNHRVRLTVFRSSGGFYTPKTNHPEFLITCSQLNDSFFKLNSNGLRVGIFNEIKIQQHVLSNLKTCNSLPNILAGIYCQVKGFDDCLMLNTSENVSELTSSNVFIFKNNSLLTPALSEGCVDGTMRKTILEIAKSKELETHETSIKLLDLEQADEIWLTNAIQGIRWIKIIETLRFENKIASQFVQLLNEKIKQKNI